MKRYLASLVILGIVLLGQTTALAHGHLFRLPAFHVIMHILGGVGIGLFMSGLIGSFSGRGQADMQAKFAMSVFANFSVGLMRHRHALIVAGVFTFGIIWEIFEAHFHLTGFRLWTAAYYIDTVKDLLNDIIGGLLVLLAEAWRERMQR